MKVFISHSSKDIEIVEHFITLLTTCLGINPNNVLCTSLDGYKIQSGENWRDSIKGNIENSDIFFLVITKNYKASEICLNEMGAIWVSAKDNSSIIPVIIPPMSVESVGPLQEIRQVEDISVEYALDRIKDLVIGRNKTGGYAKSDLWARRKNDFLLKVREFSTKLQSEIDNDVKLTRGGFTQFIVDSSFTHAEQLTNIELRKQLISDLKTNQDRSIDLKYNYLGSTCASNWLGLSQNPSYGHARLIKLIENNIEEIISAMKFKNKNSMDFISLGPGDGVIDSFILNELNKANNLGTYYPLDLSFDLLQEATQAIITNSWINIIRLKAIHGDFTNLIKYKSIYDYDDQNTNLFGLLGYTFGNFNESEFIGKIKEGMNEGDYLFLDVRLHDLQSTDRLSREEKEKFLYNYNSESNNRFAFGAIESVTIADYQLATFEYDVHQLTTTVPNAINIVTYCRDINTRFRADRRPFRKDKIALSASTVYSFEELSSWLKLKKFQIVWEKKANSIGLFLLKKI
jgi:hypothetical protein